MSRCCAMGLAFAVNHLPYRLNLYGAWILGNKTWTDVQYSSPGSTCHAMKPPRKIVVRNCSKFAWVGANRERRCSEAGQAVTPSVRYLRPCFSVSPPRIAHQIRRHSFMRVRLITRIGSWEAHAEAVICMNLVEDPPTVLTSAIDRLVKVRQTKLCLVSNTFSPLQVPKLKTDLIPPIPSGDLGFR